MPRYDFQHVETGEVHEVFFHMNDAKIYSGPDGTQTGEWRRVFSSPNATIDGKIDPFNKRDFVEKTGRKKDSVGALLDRARDAHLERVQKDGKDPIKEKFLKDYKSTNGVEHYSVGKSKTVSKNGIKVVLD